jgi:hypothetical protein
LRINHKKIAMKDNPLIKVSLKWGLIYAGISCLSLLGTYLFGEIKSMALALVFLILSLAIVITILVLSNKELRNKYLGGYIKYWQCLVNNILIFLISSIVILLISYVLYKFVDPESFNQIVENKLVEFSSNDQMPQEMKQNNIDAWVAMTPFKYVMSGFVVSFLIGVVFSLLVSIFTRKKNNSFDGVIKEIE